VAGQVDADPRTSSFSYFPSGTDLPRRRQDHVAGAGRFSGVGTERRAYEFLYIRLRHEDGGA
jgi:hypothetical protein